MGCANSKQNVCKNCQEPLTPRMPRRSKSVHVHRLPENKEGGHHLVSLTSSTLGSLRLDPLHNDHYFIEELPPSINVIGKVIEKKSKEEFVLIEAKTWSRMLEEKIPKAIPRTPNQMPSGEPDIINAWELMEGLEDATPPRYPHHNPHHHLRSYSYRGVMPSKKNSIFYDDPVSPSMKKNVDQETISMVDHGNESNLSSDTASNVPEFDPEVISTFRKAFEELPPVNPFHLKPVINETGQALMSKNVESEVCDVKKTNGVIEDYKSMASKEKLVLYFTSLRGVRKTFEDCCYVRVILKGLGVKIDEKDVSMHSGFKEELKELLGEGYPGGGLPKLFIGTQFIGGAEEIRRMNEEGQLEKLVERCEKLDNNRTLASGIGGVCEACGDIRFMPCDTCSGSCKLFCEGDFDEENEEDEYGFQRCPNCNENGLVRCPVCCG